MSTESVPGANPANADTLHVGCWAEHSDGSLIYIKGTENGQIVFEIYDLAQDPVVYYQDAMREEAFKKAFSFPPVGTSGEKWTWHDKSDFPWDRVMKTFGKPKPEHADVHETLSAAARVAESLRLRGQKLKPEDKEHLTEQELPKGSKNIVKKIQAAIEAFMEA